MVTRTDSEIGWPTLLLSDDQIIRRCADHICLSEIDCDTPETMYDALDDILPFSTSHLPTTDNPGCRHSQESTALQIASKLKGEEMW